jgi:hypothetical protein
MTTTIRLRTSMALPLALALLAGACDDETHEPEPGDGDHPDGGEPRVDAGDGDQADSGMPVLCGVTDSICNGDTPVCVDGQCVECSPENVAQCAPMQVCNPATHRCDSKNTPFALDCGNLPTDGACQGGPREVLLVAEKTGLVLMFDPTDGHYLGRFKNPVPDRASDQLYWTATQGPDQCIWSTAQGTKGVERWDTDGTLKDEIIPLGRYFDGQDDLMSEPKGLAFTKDRVYVANAGGIGANVPRVVSFDLSKLAAPPYTDDFTIEIDDGSKIESLIVLGDGSYVVANATTERVELLPADGSQAVPLLSMVQSFYATGQISYAGAGDVLASDSWNGQLYKVNVDTQMAKQIQPNGDISDNIYGTAALGNGNWFYTSDGTIEALLPESTQPVGQHEQLWNDQAVVSRDFHYVGRACLPEAFVAQQSTPDAEITDCDAPAGDELFAEDFDDGDFTGSGAGRHYNDFYELPADGVTISIDTTVGGAEGSAGCVFVNGAAGVTNSDGDLVPDPETPSGLKVTFDPALKPTYVSYYVRTSVENAWAGYFVLNNYLEDEVDGIYFTSDFGDEFGETIDTHASHVHAPFSRNEWMHVQLRDIDWEQHTYDLYVDCERKADDIPFWSDAVDDVHSLALRNLFPTDSAYFDQIVFK